MKALMIAGLAGDRTAYRYLLEAAVCRLRSYFGRRLGAEYADLEDLVQETLVALHRRRASYDRALPFTAWLHAIARYKLIDHYRRRGLRQLVSLGDAEKIPSPDDLDGRLAAIDVDRLLANLPEKHRLAIRMTRIEGYSIPETAALTGRTEPAVKVSVHRGIKRLRKRVGSHADD